MQTDSLSTKPAALITEKEAPAAAPDILSRRGAKATFQQAVKNELASLSTEDLVILGIGTVVTGGIALLAFIATSICCHLMENSDKNNALEFIDELQTGVVTELTKHSCENLETLNQINGGFTVSKDKYTFTLAKEYVEGSEHISYAVFKESAAKGKIQILTGNIPFQGGFNKLFNDLTVRKNAEPEVMTIYTIYEELLEETFDPNDDIYSGDERCQSCVDYLESHVEKRDILKNIYYKDGLFLEEKLNDRVDSYSQMAKKAYIEGKNTLGDLYLSLRSAMLTVATALEDIENRNKDKRASIQPAITQPATAQPAMASLVNR